MWLRVLSTVLTATFALGCRDKIIPERASASAIEDAATAPDGLQDGDVFGEDVGPTDASTDGVGQGSDAVNTPDEDVPVADVADVKVPSDASFDSDGDIDGTDDVSEGGPVTCTPAPGVRQVRLLTRREYDRTVSDLLGDVATKDECGGDADCDILSASCTGGFCATDPCAVKTFAFDPQGQSLNTVHVAGDFNGWPGSPEQGLSLQWFPSKGLWVGKRVFADGNYLYKYVLDGKTWVADPKSAAIAPDGFGGNNTVLAVACGGAESSELPASPSAGFPNESRPEGFAFDDHVASAVVTSVHVERYLAAAKTLAAAISPATFTAGCTSFSESCAKAFVESFGRRAFRRPLTAAETTRYVARVMAAPSLDQGVRLALRVFLSSPYFLYRFELGSPKGDGTATLDAWELASALSYFLTGSMPDGPLFEVAESGALTEPAVLKSEAERLLTTPRAREHLSTFAMQWLGLERLATSDKSPLLFPSWSTALRDAMVNETRRFFEHVVFDSTGALPELLNADWSYANDLLADLYGAPGAFGGALEKVTGLPHRGGAGLLGHASVLSATSHSDQTSPIRRGLFVRGALLCQELGAPPPNAGGVPEVDPNATTRERFAQHSADPFCQGCHQYIDELGFGFERYDAMGAWRTAENGEAISPEGDMNDLEYLGSGSNAPYADLAGLAATLVGSKAVKRCFVKQAFRFESGRHEAWEDGCQLDHLEAAFADAGWDIRTLLVAIATSHAFRVRSL